MGIIEILKLPNAQLFPNLSDISRVNLEAILVLDILFGIIVAVNPASIGLQVLCIHGDAQIVADLFPT